MMENELSHRSLIALLYHIIEASQKVCIMYCMVLERCSLKPGIVGSIPATPVLNPN